MAGVAKDGIQNVTGLKIDILLKFLSVIGRVRTRQDFLRGTSRKSKLEHSIHHNLSLTTPNLFILFF